MRSYLELVRWAIEHPTFGAPDPTTGGCFQIMRPDGQWFNVIASWSKGWDHISVTLLDATRCPTWDEMQFIKRNFFRDDEYVMQLHVPPAKHKNVHPFCLHLWRPQNEDIPIPPAEFV